MVTNPSHYIENVKYGLFSCLQKNLSDDVDVEKFVRNLGNRRADLIEMNDFV